MRKGGSKQKGAQFEREVCKALSLWVTNGRRGDVFWRAAMSGGRATMFSDVRQCGDICAVAPEGAAFCDMFFAENKHYKDLQITSWLLTGKGHLAQFWEETWDQAGIHHRRPLLIFRQNAFPIMFLYPANLPTLGLAPIAVVRSIGLFSFADWLTTRYKDQTWLLHHARHAGHR